MRYVRGRDFILCMICLTLTSWTYGGKNPFKKRWKSMMFSSYSVPHPTFGYYSKFISSSKNNRMIIGQISAVLFSATISSYLSEYFLTLSHKVAFSGSFPSKSLQVTLISFKKYSSIFIDHR